MKQFKNNFTTHEQSRGLLEIGLPKWTADCFIDSWEQIQLRILNDLDKDFFEKYSYIPSWSVGRLIEIMNICSICGHVSIHKTDREVSQIDQLIEILQNRINGKTIDFSKLEAV